MNAFQRRGYNDRYADATREDNPYKRDIFRNGWEDGWARADGELMMADFGNPNNPYSLMNSSNPFAKLLR